MVGEAVGEDDELTKSTLLKLLVIIVRSLTIVSVVYHGWKFVTFLLFLLPDVYNCNVFID